MVLNMIIVVAAVSMTMAMTIVIVNGRYPLFFFSSEHMHSNDYPTTSVAKLKRHSPQCCPIRLKNNYNVL